MLSKWLVLVAVGALALTACKKKDTKKAPADEGMSPTASMNPMQDDAMGGAANNDPKVKIDAMKVADRALKMQVFLTDRLFNSLPDCDKGADAASAMLDEPEWKKLMATIKANRAAVKAAQSKLLAADRSKYAFVRKRVQVMMKCKDNKKHLALAKRLAAVWQ